MTRLIAERAKLSSPLPRLFFALLLSAITTSSCGGGGGGGGMTTTVTPPAAYGALDGYVYAPVGSGARQADAAPGYKPVSGAAVSAVCGKTTKNTTSDSTGHYTFSSMPTGSCSLTITKSGFTTYTVTAAVSANATTTVGGSSGASLSPSSSGSIKITANVSGGGIFLDGETTGITIPSTLTYTLANIAPGSHSVSMKKSGYDTVATQTVTVAQGQTKELLFMLNPTGNRAPAANAGGDAKWFAGTKYENDRAQSLIENKNIFDPVPISYQLDGSGSSDADANALTYRWAQISGPTVTISDATASRPTFIPDKTGIYVFGLSVSDGYLRSSTDTVSIDIQKLTGKITYAAPNGTDVDLYIVNFDVVSGTGWKQLTDNNADDSNPAWSPDGGKIAYVCLSTDPNICVINKDGSGYIQLTNDQKNYMPDWSPDGTKIVWSKGPSSSNSDIYTMSSNGSNVTKLTSIGGTVNAPKYSFDGSKILFIQNFGGDNYEVVVMDSNGSNIIRLTNNSTTETGVAWMPDGRIIYTSAASLSEYPRHLYLINTDGTGKQEISIPNLVYSMLGQPTVSADGRFIFIEGQNDYIYVIYTDGSAAYNLGFWGGNPDYHPGP